MSSVTPGTRRVRSLSLGLTLSALALVLALQAQHGGAPVLRAQTQSIPDIYTPVKTTQGVRIRAGVPTLLQIGDWTTSPLISTLLGGLQNRKHWLYRYVGTEPPYTGPYYLSAAAIADITAGGETPPQSTLATFEAGNTYFAMSDGDLILDNGSLFPLPSCGNGVLDNQALSYYATPEATQLTTVSPEGCDDGNTAAGDGCTATCTPEAWSAQIVLAATSTVPASLNGGNSFTLTGDVRNAGTSSWSAGQVTLRAALANQFPTITGLPVSNSAAVPSGGSFPFSVTVTAPSVSAATEKVLDFVATKGYGTGNPVNIGAHLSRTITVNPSVNSAALSATPPAAVRAGTQFTVPVSVTNTGTRPFTTAAYSLKVAINFPNLSWGVTTVALPETIAVNETKTVNVTLTAPANTSVSSGPKDVILSIAEGAAQAFASITRSITVNHCGDGIKQTNTNPAQGEQCDIPNHPGCSAACTRNVGFTCTADATGSNQQCTPIIPGF